MEPTQFYIAIAVAPTLSVLIMLGGIMLQNSRVNDLRVELKDLLRAELAAG